MSSGSRFLRPPSLPQGHLFARLRPGAVLLPAPGVVLPEATLGVRSVVEVDLRDLGLDEAPNSPGHG